MKNIIAILFLILAISINGAAQNQLQYNAFTTNITGIISPTNLPAGTLTNNWVGGVTFGNSSQSAGFTNYGSIYVWAPGTGLSEVIDATGGLYWEGSGGTNFMIPHGQLNDNAGNEFFNSSPTGFGGLPQFFGQYFGAGDNLTNSTKTLPSNTNSLVSAAQAAIIAASSGGGVTTNQLAQSGMTLLGSTVISNLLSITVSNAGIAYCNGTFTNNYTEFFVNYPTGTSVVFYTNGYVASNNYIAIRQLNSVWCFMTNTTPVSLNKAVYVSTTTNSLNAAYYATNSGAGTSVPIVTLNFQTSTNYLGISTPLNNGAVVTVSAVGIANGLSQNNGAMFGPDTPATTTCGLQEAANYGQFTNYTGNAGPVYQAGTLLLQQGVYPINSALSIGFCRIEGAGKACLPVNNTTGSAIVAGSNYMGGTVLLLGSAPVDTISGFSFTLQDCFVCAVTNDSRILVTGNGGYNPTGCDGPVIQRCTFTTWSGLTNSLATPTTNGQTAIYVEGAGNTIDINNNCFQGCGCGIYVASDHGSFTKNFFDVGGSGYSTPYYSTNDPRYLGGIGLIINSAGNNNTYAIRDNTDYGSYATYCIIGTSGRTHYSSSGDNTESVSHAVILAPGYYWTFEQSKGLTQGGTNSYVSLSSANWSAVYNTPGYVLIKSPVDDSSESATNALTVTTTGITNSTDFIFDLTVTAGTALTLKNETGATVLPPPLYATFPLWPGWSLTGTAVTGYCPIAK